MIFFVAEDYPQDEASPETAAAPEPEPESDTDNNHDHHRHDHDHKKGHVHGSQGRQRENSVSGAGRLVAKYEIVGWIITTLATFGLLL